MKKSLGFLVIVLAFSMLMFGCQPKYNLDSPPVEEVELNASVKWQSGVMHVENQDYFNWENVEIEINDLFTGFVPRIESKQTKDIDLVEFTKSDGERFNPYTHEVNIIKIKCKSNGKIGSYVGERIRN